MLIVKPGVIHHGFEGRWRCQKCGCEWEMDAKDTKPAQSNDQRDGDAYHMPCPTFGTDTWRAIPRDNQFDR